MKNTTQARPPKQTKYEYQQEMRQKAIEASKKYIENKPIKYDLKH